MDDIQAERSERTPCYAVGFLDQADEQMLVAYPHLLNHFCFEDRVVDGAFGTGCQRQFDGCRCGKAGRYKLFDFVSHGVGSYVQRRQRIRLFRQQCEEQMLGADEVVIALSRFDLCACKR